MSAKHTPGPWTLAAWPHERECMGAELGARAVVGADRISPAVVWGGIAESAANARLIAAAPELLDALRDALSHWPSADDIHLLTPDTAHHRRCPPDNEIRVRDVLRWQALLARIDREEDR